jgi:hypothetical protein
MSFRDFYFGMFIYFIQQQIFQDAIGKERYIKLVDLAWMNTSVWFWLTVLILGVFVYFWTMPPKKPSQPIIVLGSFEKEKE